MTQKLQDPRVKYEPLGGSTDMTQMTALTHRAVCFFHRSRPQINSKAQKAPYFVAGPAFVSRLPCHFTRHPLLPGTGTAQAPVLCRIAQCRPSWLRCEVSIHFALHLHLVNPPFFHISRLLRPCQTNQFSALRRFAQSRPAISGSRE